MTKQTTVRIPDELAAEAEAVARVKDMSLNSVIIASLQAEIQRVKADGDFTARAKKLIERDKELLERLAR
ncbi:YlcI/YnfO family protein [Ferrimicrobium sp.]|uniref:YlcI/YnfO family protein n=1 Tax=Ferrimicrobium sp. TaxID=2926050 RepID=UPI00261D7789|nr:YlcI/YnfO family protein [Ferrimicrobium sp.]